MYCCSLQLPLLWLVGIFDSNVVYCFDFSGVEHLSDGTILVLTYTGVLKELRLSIVAGKIDIKFRNLNINIDWTSYRTHGLVISPNKVFLVVLVSMSKLAWVRRNKSNTKVFVFMNMARNPLTVLLQNPTRSMFLFWDCLETLRYKFV